MDRAVFDQLPIMGILRGVKAEIIAPLTESMIQEGLRTVEITMNTPGAPDLIREMVRRAEGHLTVGAGTVLTLDERQAALEAGAQFIVMPTFIPSIVRACVRDKIPVFPGALTPQEIFNAWQGGATMVKVFPVKFFGPDYMAEIKGPFQDIPLLACGGITPENIGDFFTKGASAVAFGSGIFRPEWLSRSQLPVMAKALRTLISSYKKNRQPSA